jgi:hypothetical protein
MKETLLDRIERAYSQKKISFDDDGSVTSDFPKLADEIVAILPAPVIAGGINSVRRALGGR